MQFKTIYLNGCSFMWGVGHSNPSVFKYFEETKNIDASYGEHFNGKTLFNNYDWVRHDTNISGRLKKYYGELPLIDESIYGGSLQRVIRKTYNWIFNNDKQAKETLFILEWPIGVRNEMYIPLQKRYVNYTANFDNFDNIDPYLHRLMINEIAPNFFADGVAFLEDLQAFVGLLAYIKSIGGTYLLLLDEFPFDNISDETIKYVSKHQIKNILNNVCIPNAVVFEKDGKKTRSMIEYYREYEQATFTIDTMGELIDDHNSIRASRLITEQIIKNINELT
jgi:hypothetical protein